MAFSDEFVKQKGAVMLEAAYVLPLMMVVLLLIIEAVNYSLDSLKMNDVMADGYQVLLSQSQQLHDDPARTDLSLVSCMGHKIVPNETALKDWLVQSVAGSVGKNPSGLVISTTKQTVSGILTYVFKMSYPSQTLFVPEDFAQVFSVKTQGLFSFDLSC